MASVVTIMSAAGSGSRGRGSGSGGVGRKEGALKNYGCRAPMREIAVEHFGEHKRRHLSEEFLSSGGFLTCIVEGEGTQTLRHFEKASERPACTLLGGKGGEQRFGKRRYEYPTKAFPSLPLSLSFLSGESRLASRTEEELFGAYGGATNAQQRWLHVNKQVRITFSLPLTRYTHALAWQIERSFEKASTLPGSHRTNSSTSLKRKARQLL